LSEQEACAECGGLKGKASPIAPLNWHRMN
jgi:hypothetical protein